MKKAILTIVLMGMLMPMGLHAQIGNPRNTLAIGINGGATNGNIDFSPTIKQDLFLGNTMGLTARYTSEKYFFLICGAQLEINYVQRGWKEFITDGSGNEYSRRLNYIEMPFYAHLGVGREARGIQGFLNLGPQVGYYLDGKETYGGQEPWNTENRPNSVTEQYGKEIENKVEYGISAGAGLECKTGIGVFDIEGRYYFGLSDIFGNSKADYFGRSASTTIYVKLAYLIELTH